MTHFARVLNGEVPIVKVEAAYGADAVEQICAAIQVASWQVYLVSEEEAMEYCAAQKILPFGI